MFGEKELEEKCLHLIDETADEALKSEAFSQVNRDTVSKIVQRDTLDVEEIRIYQASISWAEAECCRQGIQVLFFLLFPFYHSRKVTNANTCVYL